jgi:phenylacetate-CoA ligase
MKTEPTYQAAPESRLAEVLRWADRSPFYRRRGVTAAFADLPLTTKRDLRDGYPFDLLAVDRRDLATYHESSGTAGTPTASYYTAEDWTDLVDRYARKYVGIGPDDTFLVRTPYALMITGHLAHAAARRHGATVVPGDNRSLAMPYSRVVRLLHDLGVTLTWSLPTEPLLWAAAARRAGHRPGRDFPALRALFVGGEPLTATRRARIAELWQVPVVEEYGSTETGSLAGQCPHGRMHLWADRAYFEVFDPDSGELRREGRGQLVVTPLYRKAMPLLRYNIEDDVTVSCAPCPCGWRLPTVEVLGRSALAWSVRGVPVTQAALESLVYALPIRYEVLFWRAKAEPTGLRVDIEAEPGHHADATGALRLAIRDTLGIDAELRALAPGTLVPADVLTRTHDVVKPRCLFGPGEDWSTAWLYY